MCDEVALRLNALDDRVDYESEHEGAGRVSPLGSLLAAQLSITEAHVPYLQVQLKLRVYGVFEPDEGRRMDGGLSQHLGSDRIIKGIKRIVGDSNVSWITTELDEGVPGVTEIYQGPT